jgi:hypothetical protein
LLFLFTWFVLKNSCKGRGIVHVILPPIIPIIPISPHASYHCFLLFCLSFLQSMILLPCVATVCIVSFARFPLFPFEIICNSMQDMWKNWGLIDSCSQNKLQGLMFVGLNRCDVCWRGPVCGSHDLSCWNDLCSVVSR